TAGHGWRGSASRERRAAARTADATGARGAGGGGATRQPASRVPPAAPFPMRRTGNSNLRGNQMSEKPRDTALVVFTPSGKRGHFPLGTPLLQAARSLGVDVDSVCGGRAICGRCQVVVSEGEFAKHGIRSGAD